ncbi:MAG TPA: radical SAM protein [Blastocatellia bacterium]|nr:radical SAM protein [Blastocatellia bacterium]
MRYVNNPPNPYLTTSVEWIGEPPAAKLEVFEETATRSIITRNNSPDIPFDFSVNCYRGCPHACTYCFSRPTHEYLGWGAGTDFERKIVAKVNAPELLRAEFRKKSWQGDTLNFSFTSDPYVPLEASYQLTRQCLEVCLEFRNPVAIITKSALIRRDKELIAALAREAAAEVFFTIPFADPDTSRAVEPFAPYPQARFAAMKDLADAGIPVGLGIAPVIPGLSESHIPELLHRAKEAGATQAFFSMLRLPGNVAPYFVERLEQTMPDRAPKILKRIREIRDGKLNSSNFGERMRGSGIHWDMVVKVFKLHCDRLGLNQQEEAQQEQRATPRTFRRPTAQPSLFE